MAPDEKELIVQAQTGDMEAFERLVFLHDKQVLSIAARYVTSAEDAKDIYQEVFLKVYRGIRKFKFRSEFSTWLHRITLNVCLTHRSRQRRRLHIPLHEETDADDESHGHAEELQSSEPGPDRKTIETEISVRIQAALDTLSPQQRMVFTLRHYEEYKLKEIAVMMNCAEGTVKRYLFAATRRMREELNDLT